jgi:hypothetical protein
MKATKEVLTEYVKTKLMAAALEAALPYGFAQNCWNDLEHELEEALKQLGAKDGLNDAAKIAAAETNTRLLVARMKVEAKDLAFNQLQEETLRRALKNLCPLWPFCKTRIT